MINLEKIKYEKCHPPLLRRPAPAPYFHPLFKIFQIPPPSPRGNNSPFKKGGGGSNYGTMNKRSTTCDQMFIFKIFFIRSNFFFYLIFLTNVVPKFYVFHGYIVVCWLRFWHFIWFLEINLIPKSVVFQIDGILPRGYIFTSWLRFWHLYKDKLIF